MQLFFAFWVIAIIVIGIKNMKYAVAMYIPYIILVPYMSLKLGGITLQWNFVNTILLLEFLFHHFAEKQKYKKTQKIDLKPFKPFFVLFGVQLFMMVFQDVTPLNFQLSMWRVNLMQYLFLPVILWNVCKSDSSAIKIYRNITLICIFVAAVYGLVLTQMVGINPYIFLMADLNDVMIDDAYLDSEDTGRIFGRITSCFVHPMTFGLFIGLSIIYCYYCRKIVTKWIIFPLIFLLAVNAVTCGVRSAIAGVMGAAAFYLFAIKKVKLTIAVALLAVAMYLIVLQIPGMDVYLNSMIDVNNSDGDIKGSSFDMRLTQFLGCFDVISNNTLYGNGYQWTQFYMEKYIEHPVLLCFESLIFVILCNSGFIGVFLWAFFFFLLFKNNKQYRKSDCILLNTMVVFYFGYCCITGEYGYMKVFILFYIILLAEIDNRLRAN